MIVATRCSHVKFHAPYGVGGDLLRMHTLDTRCPTILAHYSSSMLLELFHPLVPLDIPFSPSDRVHRLCGFARAVRVSHPKELSPGGAP